MAKSPEAFRTISEVAAQLDTPAHVLRFWESKFPQIKPVKRAGGRRYYRPEDIALLGGIKVLLHEQGMTIRGAQKLLRERGIRHVASMSALPWDGEAEEEPDNAAPEGVIVGPWQAAGLEESEDERTVELPARPVAHKTKERSPAVVPPRGQPPLRSAPVRLGQTGINQLRQVLEKADRNRLRTAAGRLAPLVERLRTLSERTSRTGA